MASTSAPIAMDSSTVASRRWGYDVFLSFRGKDTRHNFTAHLLKSISQKGIHTFYDDKDLEHGMPISPALLEKIEVSRIAVVVFSENYASSTSCLDELSKIVECTESIGQTLLPIFYKVETSIVGGRESGTFHKDLEKHEKGRFKDNPDKVHKWRDALRKASDIRGEHFDNGNEADFVEKIARLVSEKIGREILCHVADNPVGLDSEIEKVKQLLRIEDSEVRFIGIVGIGGIGKTTVAKAIYNQLSEHFEGCSFLASVREESVYKSLVKLQKRLLFDCLKGEKIDVSHEDFGISLIRKRLQNRRCLIVLDDVDKSLQIEKLAGGRDWFGPGSRIIVTTRDESVLALVRASKHRMEGLCDDHSRELLSWSAFGEPSPPTKYKKVFSDVLNYAKGLPLALKVLGSSLFGEDVLKWKLTIERLKDIPEEDICKVLKVSYDGLKEDQKTIFLYIVCIFRRKKKDDVISILKSCDYHSEDGIDALVKKSLITVNQGGYWGQTLDMHDLIEEMGKDIARRKNKCLLWTLEDVRSVLEDTTGTDVIQAIYLDNSEQVLYGQKSTAHIRLNPKAFEKMPKLRMLILRGCEFSCGPSYLPNELRWLEWENYPSPSLPPGFNPRNLAALGLFETYVIGPLDGQEDMTATQCNGLTMVHDAVGSLEKLERLTFSHCKSLRRLPSKLRLPSLRLLKLDACEKLEKLPDILICPNLTVIHIRFCDELRDVPDVSGMPNLKKLRIQYCWNLITVHESVGSLEKLQYLSFSHCIRLEKLPTKLRLPSLQHLSLRSCQKLKKFPDIVGRMEHVKFLNLVETSIKELSPSFGKLIGLRNLSFTLESLEVLLECIYHLPNLERLDLGYNSDTDEELEEDFRNMRPLGADEDEDDPFLSPSSSAAAISLSSSSSIFPKLEELRLMECKNTSLPLCISKCYTLKTLKLSDSWSPQEIPELPPRLEFLYASDCDCLEMVGTTSLQAMGKIKMDFFNCNKLRGKEQLGNEMLTEWLKGQEERMISFPQLQVNLNDCLFEVVIRGEDIPVRFYHGRTYSSDDKNCRLRFRVHSKSRVHEELAGFALFSAHYGELFHQIECKWLININWKQVYAREERPFIDSGGYVRIFYIHLKEHWKKEMMLLDGWNHFSFEVEFSHGLKSIGVALIGRSGEELNFSTSGRKSELPPDFSSPSLQPFRDEHINKKTKG